MPIVFNGKTALLSETENDLFIGRNDDYNRIFDLIESGCNCAVAGQPGIGKTSMLKRLERQLSEKYTVIYLSMPTTDPEMFLRKLLFSLSVAYADTIPSEYRGKLLYTQEIQTLARGLLYGETLGEREEKKILSFLRELIKTDEEIPYRLFTAEDMKQVCGKILSDIPKKLVIIVDDLDKVFSRSINESRDQVERLYLFLTEISDLLHMPKTVWLLSLHGEIFENLEKYVFIQNDSVLLSYINEIIPLKPFSVEESRKILEKRASGKVFDIFSRGAFRLLLACSKGNPRLLIYAASKTIKYTTDTPVSIDDCIAALRANLSLDPRDLMILKNAAEKPYINAGDGDLRESVGLDTISIGQRLTELANKRFLISDYDDKQKIYRLVYVHDAYSEEK